MTRVVISNNGTSSVSVAVESSVSPRTIVDLMVMVTHGSSGLAQICAEAMANSSCNNERAVVLNKMMIDELNRLKTTIDLEASKTHEKIMLIARLGNQMVADDDDIARL